MFYVGAKRRITKKLFTYIDKASSLGVKIWTMHMFLFSVSLNITYPILIPKRYKK